MKHAFWGIGLCLIFFVSGVHAADTNTDKAKKELAKAEKQLVEGNFDKMYEAAKKAQSLDASLAASYAFSGLYLYRLEQSGPAEQEFQKALTRDTNMGMAHIYLGNLFFDRGDSDRALDEWNVGARLEDSNPEALSSLALGLFLIGKTTEATQQYKKALMYDRRYYQPQFLGDRKKGAAWSKKKIDAVAPLLQKVEKPGFPY